MTRTAVSRRRPELYAEGPAAGAREDVLVGYRYDAETRSQVATAQGKAALRSLFELKDCAAGDSVDLYFGPTASRGHEGQWIQTLPRKG